MVTLFAIDDRPFIKLLSAIELDCENYDTLNGLMIDK